MRNQYYPPENGSTTINGKKMEWVIRRSKGVSAFGIRGSRIFELTLKKDGIITGEYNKAWDKRIDNEDEESSLCLSFLIDRYGKERKKRKD